MNIKEIMLVTFVTVIVSGSAGFFMGVAVANSDAATRGYFEESGKESARLMRQLQNESFEAR